MFSVIIPLYNSEKYIERAVNSVLKQSFREFELIIVNDNSSDKSLQVVENIEDERIQIFSRSENGFGGYAARNLGIEKAKNKYVCFLDSDDEWKPNFLQEIKKLTEYFPQVNVFSSAWKESNGEISKTNAYYNFHKEKENHIVENYCKETYFGRNPIWTSVCVVEKKLFLQTGNFPDGKCKRGGDIETWLRLSLHSKIAWTNYIGAVYYKNIENSVTKSITDIKIPYVYYSVKNIISENKLSENFIFDLKKYANFYAKMSIFHSIIFNKNKKGVIKGFFPDVDKKAYFLFKVLIIFPSFILKPLYNIYRKIMLKFSKSDIG